MIRFSRLLQIVAISSLTAATAVPFGVPSPANAAVGFGASGEFTGVGPFRTVDTRLSASPVRGARSFGNGGVFLVDITGADAMGGPANVIPTANVSAAFVNFTVIGASAPGFLSAWPSDQPRPIVSNVNFTGSQAVTNMALVRPGADGKMRVGLFGAGAGTAQVTVDVLGYLSTSAGTPGGRLNRINPVRFLDTRRGPGPVGSVGARKDISVPIRGAAIGGTVPVPNSSQVASVVLNLTVTGPSASTTVTAAPTAMTNPVVADISVAAGQTRANLVVVPLGSDGRIHLFNRSGNVHLVADVMGYFLAGQATSSTTGRVLPLLAPVRAIDTRLSRATAGAGTLGPGLAENWNFADFVSSVNVAGSSVGAQNAVFMSVVAIKPTMPYPTSRMTTFMKFYAADATYPSTSNLNLALGEVVPNMVLAPLSSTDSIAVYNDFGYIHYAADIAAVVLE